MAKSPASNDTLGLPDTVYEELQRLRDLIRSDTVKRDLWANRFTAADRRKFAGPEKEVLKQHHTIELWHIARSTPTPNQCIVEAAYAVGLINESRRESLLDALGAIVEAARGPYKAAFVLMAETGMRIGEVVHLTHDDLTLTGPTPVAHIRPKEVVPGARPWRPKNGEQRAVPLSPRAVAMLRDLPRRRRWVIDRMDGTAAKANLPANDRHILAYLKTVLAKLGLEGTNHKFRHSFCTIAVLAGVDFFTLRRWVGHIDEEALKIYVHIADEQAQVTMRQLAERRQAVGRAAKPGRGRKGISTVSAQSRRGGRGAGG